jgi:hypothetical protein
VYGPLPSSGCFSASTVFALSKYATVINAITIPPTSQKVEYHDIYVICNNAISISDHTESLKEIFMYTEPNGFHGYFTGNDVEGCGMF